LPLDSFSGERLGWAFLCLMNTFEETQEPTFGFTVSWPLGGRLFIKQCDTLGEEDDDLISLDAHEVRCLIESLTRALEWHEAQPEIDLDPPG
jgi:hypothetical protein